MWLPFLYAFVFVFLIAYEKRTAGERKKESEKERKNKRTMDRRQPKRNQGGKWGSAALLCRSSGVTYVQTRVSKRNQERKKGTKGTARRHKERSHYDGGGGGGERGKRNEEADRRKISRGTHGRSVLVAGGWRIGRVAMAKRAGVFSEFGGVRPNGKPPFGKFVASPRRTMPRCRRFSSAWLIDSATNQRPRRSSTHFLHFTLYLSPPHTHARAEKYIYILTHTYTFFLSSLSPSYIFRTLSPLLLPPLATTSSGFT